MASGTAANAAALAAFNAGKKRDDGWKQNNEGNNKSSKYVCAPAVKSQNNKVKPAAAPAPAALAGAVNTNTTNTTNTVTTTSASTTPKPKSNHAVHRDTTPTSMVNQQYSQNNDRIMTKSPRPVLNVNTDSSKQGSYSSAASKNNHDNKGLDYFNLGSATSGRSDTFKLPRYLPHTPKDMINNVKSSIEAKNIANDPSSRRLSANYSPQQMLKNLKTSLNEKSKAPAPPKASENDKGRQILSDMRERLDTSRKIAADQAATRGLAPGFDFEEDGDKEDKGYEDYTWNLTDKKKPVSSNRSVKSFKSFKSVKSTNSNKTVNSIAKNVVAKAGENDQLGTTELNISTPERHGICIDVTYHDSDAEDDCLENENGNKCANGIGRGNGHENEHGTQNENNLENGIRNENQHDNESDTGDQVMVPIKLYNSDKSSISSKSKVRRKPPPSLSQEEYCSSSTELLSTDLKHIMALHAKSSDTFSSGDNFNQSDDQISIAENDAGQPNVGTTAAATLVRRGVTKFPQFPEIKKKHYHSRNIFGLKRHEQKNQNSVIWLDPDSDVEAEGEGLGGEAKYVRGVNRKSAGEDDELEEEEEEEEQDGEEEEEEEEENEVEENEESEFSDASVIANNFNHGNTKNGVRRLGPQSRPQKAHVQQQQPQQSQQQPVQFRTTMRTTNKRKDRKSKFDEYKPWKNHSDLNYLTDQERKRYEGVWVSNKGNYTNLVVVKLHGVDYSTVKDGKVNLEHIDDSMRAALISTNAYPSSKQEEQESMKSNNGTGIKVNSDGSVYNSAIEVPSQANNQSRPERVELSQLILGAVVKRIWSRSGLPDETLEQIWNLVDFRRDGTLTKNEFIVGMWLVDQCLYGRKLPKKVESIVWESLGGIGVNINTKKMR